MDITRSEASTASEHTLDSETSMDVAENITPLPGTDQAMPDANLKVIVSFNLSKYLPREGQLYFNSTVIEFIRVPVQEAFARMAAHALNPQVTIDDQFFTTASLRKALSTTMTRKLCRMVDILDKR